MTEAYSLRVLEVSSPKSRCLLLGLSRLGLSLSPVLGQDFLLRLPAPDVVPDALQLVAASLQPLPPPSLLLGVCVFSFSVSYEDMCRWL